MKNTGRPMQPQNKYTSKYLDVENTPLYPFGYGLSYSEFTYSPVRIDKANIAFNESATISVDVRNTGSRAGTEIVQLYLRDLVGSVTRPVKELKGFQKITLDPGASKTVSFSLTSDDLRFYTAEMIFKAEAGEFEVFVGGDSDTVNKLNFQLTE
jgi:beta-glucosidase